MTTKNLTMEDIQKIATLAHKGQQRNDGKNYITHPIEVAGIAEVIIHDLSYKNRISDAYENFCIDTGYTKFQVIYATALLHDVVEDASNITLGNLLDQGVSVEVIKRLKILDKRNYPNYLSYIKAISMDEIASIVKLADLRHNMSDLSEGSLKDKYRLAEELILNANPRFRV